MRILLLNQFVPPDPSPTARLLGDVATELEKRGHEIVWIGNSSNYRGSKTLWGSRALRELAGLAKLLCKGWAAPKCDTIFFLTSPPLLPIIARMIGWRHRGSQLIHWAMDVYPDIAIALGEANENSVIGKVSSRLVSHAYRKCEIIIALDEDMAGLIGRSEVSCKIQAPWPPQVPPSSIEFPASETFRILYSGNLGRAHDWKTILDAVAILENGGASFELVFQGGGAERTEAEAYAKSLGVTSRSWTNYVDDEELLPSLLAADALLVTQLEETKGCLWPSKLALSELTGVPILWIGPKDSAVSQWLNEKGHHAFSIGEAEKVAQTVQTLIEMRDTIRTKKRNRTAIASDAERLGEEGCRTICDWVELK